MDVLTKEGEPSLKKGTIVMQHLDIKQGSEAWFKARSGIPTASCFDAIITPTGTRADGYEVYANTLIAEIMTGGPVEDWGGNRWTERGNEFEDEAVLFYEMQKGSSTDKVGFVTNYSVGCSPDRYVDDDGLLEVKSPKASTQVKYLLSNSNKMPSIYIPQVQGQLYVTGRKWCDWLSYSPEVPSIIIRVYRDESYITKLSGALQKFLEKIETKKTRLSKLGYLTKD